jgi:hypothetical protein
VGGGSKSFSKEDEYGGVSLNQICLYKKDARAEKPKNRFFLNLLKRIDCTTKSYLPHKLSSSQGIQNRKQIENRLISFDTVSV